MRIITICAFMGFYSISGYSQILYGQFVSMSLSMSNPEMGYLDGLGAPIHGTGGNSCLLINSGFVLGPTDQWENAMSFNYNCEPAKAAGDDQSNGVAWRVYPNPSQGEYFLEAEGVKNWQVYDNQGRLVATDNNPNQEAAILIRIQDKSAGSYVLRFEQEIEGVRYPQQTKLIKLERLEPSTYD